MQSFPNPGDVRLAMYPAYYINSNNPRQFLSALDEVSVLKVMDHTQQLLGTLPNRIKNRWSIFSTYL
jgi:hypothetical protein